MISAYSAVCITECVPVFPLRVFAHCDLCLCFTTVSSSMIELSVVESAVQDCTQSCDETM